MAKHAFHIALEAWRKTRSPRFAAIVDAISAKEPERELVGASGKKADIAKWFELADAEDWRDMPRLLATLTTCNSPQALERVNKLKDRDDPRLVSGLLAIAEAAPYTAGSSRKFWQAVLSALEVSRDPRARDGMISLSKRYKTINDTVMGAWIGSAMAKGAAKIAEPKALDAKQQKLLAELEVQFLGAVGASRPKEKPKPSTSPEELFAEIIAHPDDDDQRLVYADLLSEQGESDRAELIVLQVERAAGRGTPERSDLERTKFTPEKLKAFSSPLSAAAADVFFERGFPHRVVLASTGLAHVTDAPEWGTVRVLEGVALAPATAVQRLLDSGVAKNLQVVEALRPAWLDKLRTATFPWTHVAIINEKLKPKHLERFPKLTHLEVLRDGLDVDLFAAVPNVESIELESAAPDDGAHLFANNPKLRRLLLGYRATPENYAGLKLDELHVKGNAEVGDRFLRGLPTVRELHFGGGTARIAEIIPLFDRYPALQKVAFRFDAGAEGPCLERHGKKLMLVAYPGRRGLTFWKALEDAKKTLGARAENLVLYPERPRHQGRPVGPEERELLEPAWPKMIVKELL